MRDTSLLKGMVAGLAGGLVASFVMNEFQTVWSKATEAIQPDEEDGQAEDESGEGNESEEEGGEEQEPATVKTASAISENVLGHHLTKAEKEKAGPAVHYAFGASVGAVYGLVAEQAPQVTVGAGVPFGTVVCILADETAVPLAGLSEPPWTFPASTHAYAFASHFVYGFTTEMVRRLVRRIL